MKEKTRAETLAEFIVDNWHFCPINSTVNIPESDCHGWQGDKCVNCIQRYAKRLKATD